MLEKLDAALADWPRVENGSCEIGLGFPNAHWADQSHPGHTHSP